MPLRVSIAFVIALWGCGSGCGEDGPLVPFKLNGKGSGSTTTTGGPAPEQEPTEGVSYPELTANVTVQGHKLSIKGHSFRATLEADLNQDARRDLLAVVQDERGVPLLATAPADAEGLGSLELKGALVGEGESCVLESAALRRLSATFVLLRMRVACGEPSTLPGSLPASPAGAAAAHEGPPAPPEPEPPAKPDAPGEQATALLALSPLDVLVRIDGEPSIVERLQIDESATAADPSQTSDKAEVSAAWSAGDVDADGHVDLTLQLTTQTAGQEPVTLAVHFLDRPSGLALDTSAIEKVWLAIADESKLARKGQPDKAYALAKRVVASHAAICRESGHASIEVGGERGLPCGASLGAGRSASIEAAVLARRGQLFPALALSEDLQKSSVYSLTDNDKERVRYAIAERTKTAVWKPGPTVVLGAAPAVRRSAIAFLDESRLLSRGVQGALAHNLASGAQEPASAILADLVIRDPAGKRALSSIATRCDGVHAAIVNAAQVVAGVATGAPIAEPILWPSAHTVAACEKTNTAFDDVPELQVLGWTKAGIQLAVGGALYSVPIDDANVASAPLPLTPASAASLSELGASAVSTGTRMVLVPTSAGLARVSPQAQAMLIAWPLGVTRGAVSDVAISPSGRYVAVLSSGRVQVADLNEAPPPSPPPTAPGTAPPAPPEPGHAP